MNAQFIHIEEYSFLRNKNGRPDIGGVLSEVSRVASHSKHITQVKKPKLIMGKKPSSMFHELKRLHSTIKPNNRKIRKDARVLLAGVASYPKKLNSDDFQLEHFKSWLGSTTDFLKSKFGSNLQSVILHSDEEFPHIHFYCYNSSTLSLNLIHPGKIQEQKIKTKKGRKIAFINGMKGFQDDYYKQVSLGLNILRHNKLRERRSRKNHLELKTLYEKLNLREQQISNLKYILYKLKVKFKNLNKKFRPNLNNEISCIHEINKIKG
jgi:hypothetical protein